MPCPTPPPHSLRAATRRFVPLLPLLALGLTALPATAAPWMDHHGHDGASQAQTPATVSVSGHGEAVVAPDLAVVNVGVTTQAPSAAEAMRANAERQQEVIDSLKGLGVAPRDIQTSGLNLSPLQDYSREGEPPVITGYQASNIVTVRVRALPDLGRVLDSLVTAGANEIQGISFQREDAGAAEAEARSRAVANASARAATIAAAAGQQLGRVLTISDSGGGGGMPRPMMRMANAADAQSTPVEAGELSIAADVMVTWEMRPARHGGSQGGGHHPMGGMMMPGHMQGGGMGATMGDMSGMPMQSAPMQRGMMDCPMMGGSGMMGGGMADPGRPGQTGGGMMDGGSMSGGMMGGQMPQTGMSGGGAATGGQMQTQDDGASAATPADSGTVSAPPPAAEISPAPQTDAPEATTPDAIAPEAGPTAPLDSAAPTTPAEPAAPPVN